MKKLFWTRLILFLWAAVSVFFTFSYYRLATGGEVRTLHKLAVVFWAVQSLIALVAFIMSLRSAKIQAKSK